MKTMETRLYHAGVSVLYHATLLVGIMLLPVALLARRAGVPLPFNRVLSSLKSAYDR